MTEARFSRLEESVQRGKLRAPASSVTSVVGVRSLIPTDEAAAECAAIVGAGPVQAASGVFTALRQPVRPRKPKPASIMAQVDGSGTEELTEMLSQLAVASPNP